MKQVGVDRGCMEFREMRKRQDGTEDAMTKAIRAWLQCPRDKRPSSQALGKRIAEIADIYNLLDM